MNSDESAIRKLVDTWMQASRAGDTATVLNLMTDDVLFMAPGREPFGKEAFIQQSQQMANVKIDGHAEIQEIKILGDWAWLRNKLRVTITPPNAAPNTRSGYTLTILRKNSAGQWQITRDANLLS